MRNRLCYCAVYIHGLHYVLKCPDSWSGQLIADMESNEDKDDKTPEIYPLKNFKSRESDSVDQKEKRGHWASEFEYILSVIGYSVALGNVWRFPYICSRNGGGAFLIPFLLCLVLCGLPLFFLEVALGQFSGKSPVHVWSLCPLVKGLGAGMVIIAGVVPIYYTVICAWSLYYTIYSCRPVLPWTSCNNTWNTDNCVTSVKLLNENVSEDTNYTAAANQTSFSPMMTYQTNISHTHSEWENRTLSHTAAEEFWQYNALSITNGLGDLGSIRWELALCLLGSWLIILLCIIKGVKSLGKAVYITATLPYIFLIILLVRGLMLPGGPSGALFYITPDFTKLLNVQVWLEACLQMFYSLGPACGGLITTASYNKFNTNCLRNAIICTFVSEGTSLFAGLVVFSILGFMAHEADVPITDVVSSGPGLGFVTYPEVLAQLPVPQLWSFIFFVMLILLAIDFLFASIETVLSAILDEFPFLLRWRVPVTCCYCGVSYILGLVLTTEGGMYIFQLIDWYCLAIFPVFAGFLEGIVIGWVYGVKRFSSDIEMMIGKQAPVFFKVTWCYVTPLMLMITFVFALSTYQLPTYGKYVYPEYASAIGWCIASIPMVPIIVMAILAIYRGKGSLLQRIRQSLVPEDAWVPSEISCRKDYLEKYGSAISMTETCIASVSCKP